jgi:hypothetical protein
MEFENIAEKKQEQKVAAWLKLWSSGHPEIWYMQLAKKHRPGANRVCMPMEKRCLQCMLPGQI